MKRLSIFFAALMISVGSVLAAEGAAYTVTATHGTSKSYATECDIVVDGVTWTVQGNTNLNDQYSVGGWAVGGKSITNQDRAIYSKDAIKANIKKVVVTHNANNGVTVNSFALIVSDAANAAGDTVYATAADITAMADKGAVVTFTIPEGKTWNNKYYKFLYNLTNSGTSNKRIEFLKAEFSGEYTEVAATAIVLDQTTLEMEQYETAKLIATLTPADATTDIVWTSSDEKVATVKAGTITALSAGTTTITATAGAVSATCEVTVKAATALTCAEVVELAKDLNSGDILAGGKRIVRGYVTEYYKDPAADFEKYGNYSVYMADTKDGGKVFEAYQVKPVDGKTVVKVGDYVEVIGEITKYNTTIETVGKGAATISVLTTTVAVESIALDKTELNIEIGKTATLVATITPEDATNKDITWATDNDQVATVADGVVTAVAEGKANITVTTADGGYTATCIVTVKAATQIVDVTLYSVDFTNAAEAKTWTINDVVKDENLKYVWQQTTSYGMKASAYIKPTNYATESWLISPVIDFTRAKSATMTFNHARKFGSNDHLSVKATTDGSTWTTLNVSEWPDGSSWDFIEATADLTALLGSANAQIAFVYTSTTSGAATWEIKNMTVSGTETFVPATNITLNTTALTMQQYKYISLIATVAPATTTDAVVWTSDNEEVAIVSEKGVVTTMATGTANITATAGTQSATCAITVIEASYITCAQAVEIAKTVSENNVAAEGGMYVIRGYVTKYNGTPSESMEQYKNYSAWLADTKGGEGTFIAYQVKPVDGTTVANIGDYVEVVGDITQYNGTYETMGRGTATIRVISSVSTDVDNVTLQSDDVVKTIHNGQVVILRNNKVYNTLGQEISK